MGRFRSRYYISKNGFSPSTNKLVGSLTYFLFHGIVFWIAYKIWGIQMFDELWFYIMHLLAFFSVKIFLRRIGFWVY